MPNSIKYSASAQTLSLKKGNFWIGTGDVDKGPTPTTGYYNGVTPSAGGYTIYLQRTGAPGELSYHSAANDSQLIAFTNGISGQSYTTAAQCLEYFGSQTERVCFNRDYESIVTDGLVMNLDAGFSPSYPTTGTAWYDVSPGGNNGSLVNGPTYSSTNGGSIVFDGSDDYVTVADSSSLNFTTLTIEVWAYSSAYGSGGSMFVHQQSGGGFGGLEMYTNTGGTILFNKNANFTLVTGFGYALNSWKNIVCTSDGTTNRIYVNGVNTGSSAGGFVDNVSGIFRIGSWSGGGYLMNGRIPVVRFYNKALTAAQVLQNYNALKGRFGL